MRYGAVIVAAGMSRRMKDFKQLMKIGDMTFAERVITNFQRAGVQDIVIVTGYRGEELEKSLRGSGVVFLRNEQYETTKMFDSACIGFSYLKDRCDAVFFCPVDVPFFTDETVKAEMNRIESADIIVPFCHERPGHPLLLRAKAVEYILHYSGEHGMRGAYESFAEREIGTVLHIRVEDDGAVMDADTKEDFQNLLDLHNARLMRPEIRVRLCNTKPFFGPGTVTLLRQIDSMGNVREACALCGISYSKGWNIIHDCENELGYRIVERQPGGKDGGRSTLSEHGRKLILLYEQLEREMNEIAQQKFNEIFLHGDWLKKSNRYGDMGNE
ncbi:MAG TPA: ModE molybdate transport repressor domain-containing protein [Oribacterium sp.]|nr:ModE molybdate transport repressor domain-containing protein [Oribacterium sp.]